MSQPTLSAPAVRPALFWPRVAASVALAGAVLLTPAVQAQVVAGVTGSRSSSGSNAPQQAAPPQAVLRTYPQPSYPLRSYPQPAPWNNGPVFPNNSANSFSGNNFSNNVRVYRNEAPVFSGPAYPSAPGQSDVTAQAPGAAFQRRQFLPGGTDTRRTFSRDNGPYGPSPQLQRTVGPGGNAPVFDGLNNIRGEQRSIRVTTPGGGRRLPSQEYDNFVYQPGVVVDGPALLGGYYYGNYCDVSYPGASYPTVYGFYDGLPPYLYSPGLIVVGQPYYPAYATPYLPFYAPTYTVNYNEVNYYVGSPERVQQIQDGGAPGRQALKNAYPEGSFQAAFGDIEKAWTDGDLSSIRRHVRDRDTKLSVFFKGKYSYSIAAGDFLQITRDALDRLSTVSFEFTRLRKAKNGDVTAYGKHVYRAAGASGAGGDQAGTGDTVPFSTDGSQDGQPYAKSDDPASGDEKTVYVSYTLRHQDDQWSVIAVDSSPTDLVK